MESTPHRGLRKLPPTTLDGLIYSSEGTYSDRGYPWMTAVDRCLGHVGGTGRMTQVGAWRLRHQLDRGGRPGLGGHLPRWRAAQGGAAGPARALDRYAVSMSDEESMPEV